MSMTWAHDTATAVDVRAVDEVRGRASGRAADRPVATASGLVAMKATAIPLRASTRPEKRGSDLYDLARLLLVDPPDDPQLTSMPGPLAEEVSRRLRRWFVEDAGRDRTFRDIRRFDEPRIDLDHVADAVSDLLA